MPCFKDDNVCVCAISALILLAIVNLSLEMDLATSVSYNMT